MTTVSKALRQTLRGEVPKDTHLHQLPARTLWWPGGCGSGTSRIVTMQWISSKAKPTTQVGTTKKGGPRKEGEEAAAGHHLLFLAEPEHSGKKVAEAPEQPYAVSIA